MKKRTAIIGALVSLLPTGQLPVIGTGAVITSAAVMLAVSKEAYAESAVSYAKSAFQNYKDENYSDALVDINKAINLDSDNLVYYGMRGGIKSRLGDYYGTISDYNKVLRLGPEDDYYFKWRGFAKERIGDIKGACADWRKASSLGDKDAAKWVRNQCN
tara:strand:+ start:225 stop:701 length:477 start_codon:yes stop_codon:yes gene_type:complete